jgi:hypothetical protein
LLGGIGGVALSISGVALDIVDTGNDAGSDDDAGSEDNATEDDDDEDDSEGEVMGTS